MHATENYYQRKIAELEEQLQQAGERVVSAAIALGIDPHSGAVVMFAAAARGDGAL